MNRKKVINEFSIFSLELSYFLLVYEQKSINAAARKVGLDPGNISRILSRLEKSFGSALFIRHRSGLQPTPKADKFYRALTKAKQQFIDQVSSGWEEKKKVSIGFSPTVGFTYFAKYFLKAAVEQGLNPEFQLAGSLALIEAIKDRRLDLILVASAPKFPGTISQALSSENLVLVSRSGNYEKILLVSSETIGLERIVKSITYGTRWVLNDYFVLSKFLVENSELMGILPESLLDTFPKLKVIEVFQKEGKITAVTWPSSPGVGLLRRAKS